MTRQAALFHMRERRRAAANVQRTTTGFDLGTAAALSELPNPYVVAANAEYAVSFSAAVTADELTVATETARTLGTPALDPDQIRRIGYFERGRTLTPTAGIAGTVTLYVLDDWSRPIPVATGVFT